MGRRIGKPQTPTKAGYSDVFDTRQHQAFVKNNSLLTDEDDATGSLRFSGTQYLSRTPSSAGNSLTWTYSSWVKKDAFTDDNFSHWGIGAGTDSGPRTEMGFMSQNASPSTNRYKVRIGFNPAGTAWSESLTDLFIRDLNGWYHFVLAADMTQSVDTERIKFYVNGQRQTFSTYAVPAQNTSLLINSTLKHYIGTYVGTSTPTDSTYIHKGYLSHITMVDGQALDPTYFAYEDRETKQWKPKKYTGDFGVNGFHLPISGKSFMPRYRGGNNIALYNNATLEENIEDIYAVGAASFTNVWRGGEGKWGKSAWSNTHGKIELTANDAYNLKDVSASPFTIEGWTKFVEEDGRYPFFVSFGTSDYNAWSVWYNGHLDKFYVSGDTSGGGPWDIDTGISLDPYDGEWHHWAFTRNTSGQYKLHYDGEYKGIITTNTSDLVTNNNTLKIFSHYSDATQANADYQNPFLYHDSMRMIKGQDLYGTSDITGWSADIWNIASTKETYVGSGTNLTGTVSFLLPPSRHDSAYKETSGRNNNWRIEGFGADDTLKDSPKNTFPILNVLDRGSGTYTSAPNPASDGALTTTGSSSRNNIRGNLRISCNCYFEAYALDAANNLGVGIIDHRYNAGNVLNIDSYYDNIRYNSSGLSSQGTSYTTGDIIGVYVNVEEGSVSFYVNGRFKFKDIQYFNTSEEWYPWFYTANNNDWVVNFGQDHSFGGRLSGTQFYSGPYSDANGIGEFHYPPPPGALALCTENIQTGLRNVTRTQKYYSRDETGNCFIGYENYNWAEYGEKYDERFVDDNPFDYDVFNSTDKENKGSLRSNGTNTGARFETEAVGTGDFTIECWVKVVEAPGNNERIFVYGTNETSPYSVIALMLNTSKYLVVRLANSDRITYSTALTMGIWYHVAIVRASGTVTLYVDGTSRGTYSDSSANYAETDLHLGYDSSLTSAYSIYGLITNFRQVNGVAVYTGNFTVPTVPLETTQSSGTNIAAITGTATKVLFKPYKTEVVNNVIPSLPRCEVGKILNHNIGGGQGSAMTPVPIGPYADNSVKSLKFLGNPYTQITIRSQTNDFLFGTGAFTIEFWIKPNNISDNDYHAILDFRDAAGGTDADAFSIFFEGSSGTAGRLYVYHNNTQKFFGGQILENLKWHHVALVRTSTSSNQTQLYLNGVGGTAETISDDLNNSGNVDVEIGRYFANNNYNLYAYLSDFRIVNGTAVYSGNFTPPSGPLTTTGGTYPSTTNVDTSITASHTVFLLQPYKQNATFHDSGSEYRTNLYYPEDETGRALYYLHGD